MKMKERERTEKSEKVRRLLERERGGGGGGGLRKGHSLVVNCCIRVENFLSRSSSLCLLLRFFSLSPLSLSRTHYLQRYNLTIRIRERFFFN